MRVRFLLLLFIVFKKKPISSYNFKNKSRVVYKIKVKKSVLRIFSKNFKHEHLSFTQNASLSYKSTLRNHKIFDLHKLSGNFDATILLNNILNETNRITTSNGCNLLINDTKSDQVTYHFTVFCNLLKKNKERILFNFTNLIQNNKFFYFNNFFYLTSIFDTVSNLFSHSITVKKISYPYSNDVFIFNNNKKKKNLTAGTRHNSGIVNHKRFFKFTKFLKKTNKLNLSNVANTTQKKINIFRFSSKNNPVLFFFLSKTMFAANIFKNSYFKKFKNNVFQLAIENFTDLGILRLTRSSPRFANFEFLKIKNFKNT